MILCLLTSLIIRERSDSMPRRVVSSSSFAVRAAAAVFCPITAITALALPGYDFFIGRPRSLVRAARASVEWKGGRKGVNLWPLFAAGKREGGTAHA